MIYLDTNIFLYLVNDDSPYHDECLSLISYVQDNNIPLATSVETFQEIVYLSQKLKKVPQGIELVEKVFSLIDSPLHITMNTIKIYVQLVKKYPTITSRDLLHTAACIENSISKLITYDHEFRKIREITPLKPKNLLK